MSADLLAEFGDFSQSSGKEKAQETKSSGNADLLVDFGLWNEAEVTSGASKSIQPQNTPKDFTRTSSHIVKDTSSIELSKPKSPVPWPQDDFQQFEEPKIEHSEKKPLDLWKLEEDGSNVLFDAGTENPWTEDDFGDFATDDAFGDFESVADEVQVKEPVGDHPDTAPSADLKQSGFLTQTLKEEEHPMSSDLPNAFDFTPAEAVMGPSEPFERPSQLSTNYADNIFRDLGIRTKSRSPPLISEPTAQQDLPVAKETVPTEDTASQMEDDWGDFMDAPAGDLEGDEPVPYPPNIPTISSSPPPELDLPTEEVHPNSESMFGFVTMAGKKARPNLADIERPISFASTAPSDGEESPGWDWKVSVGPRSPRSPNKTQAKSMAPPSLLRPSLASTQRPSSFSTVASSDGDRSPGWDWKASEPPNPVEHVRPFNIPPPSVLLQLFPSIFERFQDRIFQETVSRSSDKLKDTSLLELGREVGAVSRVVGRILAGRKHRWRRDTNLSQNMKIGPAQAGKGGGMKLTAVDKSENTKEEREAEDVLQTWKKYAGLFRSAVAGAGGDVVDLSENMPVRTLGQSQGGFKAPHPCALCGLMRDERVGKVDGQVEDSFGEYWTEHWGHLECRLWFEESQASLSQR